MKFKYNAFVPETIDFESQYLVKCKVNIKFEERKVGNYRRENLKLKKFPLVPFRIKKKTERNEFSF